MGRSVSSATGSIAVAYRHLEPEQWEDAEENDDGDMVTVMRDPTDEDYQCEFDGIVEFVKYRAKEIWPSFMEDDKWIDREDHAILYNSHAYIGISEYCGLVSIWLLPRTEEHSWYSEANLCEPWCEQIKVRFLREFGELQSLGRMSNGEQVFRKVA